MTKKRQINKSQKIARIASIEKLDYIRENVCCISESRITAAVDKLHKVEDIRNLLACFNQFNMNFAEGTDSLKEYAQNYNDKYATEFNGGFDCALVTLSFIKEQVFFLYKIMNCASAKPSNLSSVYGDTSSIEFATNHSIIGSLPYQGNLFDNFTELQKKLVDEIKYFLHSLDNNLELCSNQVKEEKRIGSDIKEIMYRFRKQVDELYKHVKNYKNKKAVMNKPYYEGLVNCDSNPEVVQEYFHKLNTSELAEVSLGIHENEMSQFTIKERVVFEDDASRIQHFRSAVKALIKSSLKITAKVVVYIMKYCDCMKIPVKKRFYDCFVEAYQQSGGKDSVITYAIFNSTYAQVFNSKDITDYNKFVVEIQKYA